METQPSRGTFARYGNRYSKGDPIRDQRCNVTRTVVVPLPVIVAGPKVLCDVISMVSDPMIVLPENEPRNVTRVASPAPAPTPA